MISLKTNQEKLKAAAIAILIIPVGFLLLFAFGEIFSGDLSGASHFVQLAPFLVLLYIALKWPRVGGMLIILISTVLAAIYAAFTLGRELQLETVILVEAILFLPPIISGYLLIIASQKKK